MLFYAIAVLCVIVFSAAIMFLVFYRNKVLNVKTLVSIVCASLISAFALPGIFYLISSYKNVSMDSAALDLATAATVCVYILLVFILSLIISYIVPKISLPSKRTDMLAAEAAAGEISAASDSAQGGNYLEQIFANFIGENDKEPELSENSDEYDANIDENMAADENNFEKAVDSAENIDKMGIENTLQDRDSLTIDECIEEAFRLKELGDFEGAIIYYMYALDKKPGRDLTFWIVLDICVMYKSLGQRELALDILNSYYDIYNDIMDISVKEEIEYNLSEIQA
jgi:tetratricopeptide (TPR) repeat protein